MRVGIAGPGAIGLFLCYCLTRQKTALAPPVLIDRNKSRIRKLRQTGFTVISSGRKISISPRLFTVTARTEPLDIVFVTTKSLDLGPILQKLNRRAGSRNTVVVLGNGILNPERLAKIYSRGPLLFGSFLAGADRIEETTVAGHDAGQGPMLIIHKNSRYHEEAGRLSELLNQAKIAHSFHQGDVADLLWTKNAYLCAIGPVSVLLGKTNGQILESEPAFEIAQTAMSETLAVLKSMNRRPAFFEQDPLGGLRQILKNTGANRSSMLQDALRGKKTELDLIVKPFLNAARTHGVACPTLDALYAMVKAYLGK
ncbi:MAG: ketopantoate reductase family protein [Elusimicrobia bacterium]|nr:ketopantoate reductase family protein [Elusimicrobiota bacterium]